MKRHPEAAQNFTQQMKAQNKYFIKILQVCTSLPGEYTYHYSARTFVRPRFLGVVVKSYFFELKVWGSFSTLHEEAPSESQ